MSSDAIASITQFTQYFDLLLADPRGAVPVAADAIIDRCLQIRYAVYCREFHYEPEENCPNWRETDLYDDAALHCLLLHRPTGQAAGTIRLVMNENGAVHLPFWEHCGHTLLSSHPLHPSRVPPDRCCEVSRLAVPGSFRRRTGESDSPLGNIEDLSDLGQRTFPLISLALFLAGAELMHLTGHCHAYAMMEPRLARRLSAAGFRFERVGANVDYHGLRAAFYISTELALRAVEHTPGMPILHDFVSGKIRAQSAATRFSYPE